MDITYETIADRYAAADAAALAEYAEWAAGSAARVTKAFATAADAVNVRDALADGISIIRATRKPGTLAKLPTVRNYSVAAWSTFDGDDAGLHF